MQALKARLAADSSRLHKDFHSTPDLQGEVLPVILSQLSWEEKRKSLSQEELFMSAQGARNPRYSIGCPLQSLNSFEKRTVVMSRGYKGRIEHLALDHPKLRRSQSAVNQNQVKKGGAHPPPSHPPPPVPLGQVVIVDLNRSKNEYAAVGQAEEQHHEKHPSFSGPVSDSFNSDDHQSPGVKSSFRPTDSAKLYASPEDIKAFGYKGSELGNQVCKNGAAKSRSQSLPPNVNRQQAHKVPEKETSGDSGVYSATYTTFKDRIPESRIDQNHLHEVNSKSQNEKVAYACPKNNRSLSDSSGHIENKIYSRSGSFPGKPDIPEPDYSSEEESAYSLQEDIKKRPPKKKKQTVMFAPNLVSSSFKDMSDTPHYAAPIKSSLSSASTSGNNFADLIAQKAAERKARQENGGNSAPASTTSSPIKRKNGTNGKEGLCLTDAIKGSDLFNRQKERATEIPTSATQTTTSTSNGGVKIKPNNLIKEDSLQKSSMKNSRSCPNEFNVEDGDNSSSGVSSDQEHVQQEANYVTIINTESDSITDQNSERLSRGGSRDDSSETSESSDEASDRTWILTNERAERSDSGKDSDSSSSSRRSGTLTKNAVSLVQLPPPQESGEPDIDQDSSTHETKSTLSKSVDQDTMSIVSSISSLSSGSGSSGGYPNNSLQHRHSTSSICKHTTQPAEIVCTTPSTISSKRSFSAPPVNHAARIRSMEPISRSRPSLRDAQIRSADAESITCHREKIACVSSRSATLDRNFFNSSRSGHSRDSIDIKYERSIEESLQLIRMHMDSLNEVNSLAGIPSTRTTASSDMVLAPPPEFCDSSLSNTRGAINKGAKTVIHITGDDPDTDVPVRIKPLKAGEDENHEHRTFRNKQLSEWSTKDTTDWLESLFMPEYKESFADKQIDGNKLMELNNESLINLGIRKIGHRVKMEKSLKRYRPIERIDL